MIRIKNFIAITFAILTFICCSISVFADENVTLSVDNGKVSAGETISVNVDISNNPGVLALSFKINFDNSVLSIDSIDKGSVTGFTLLTTLNDPNVDKTSIDQLTITGDAADAVTQNGTLCTLNFTVKDDAKTGLYPIEIIECMIVDENIDEVETVIQNSNIQINGITEIGDINFDGKRNDVDAALLLKHISEISKLDSNQLLYADVYVDGKIDMLDVIAIQKNKTE